MAGSKEICQTLVNLIMNIKTAINVASQEVLGSASNNNHIKCTFL